MPGNPHNLPLEPAAQEFVDATSEPPYLYQLPPEEGRKAVDAVQDSPIDKPAIDEEWITVAGVLPARCRCASSSRSMPRAHCR